VDGGFAIRSVPSAASGDDNEFRRLKRNQQISAFQQITCYDRAENHNNTD
jgi:hypothetical protein